MVYLDAFVWKINSIFTSMLMEWVAARKDVPLRTSINANSMIRFDYKMLRLQILNHNQFGNN